jgi:hypothetical protein
MLQNRCIKVFIIGKIILSFSICFADVGGMDFSSLSGNSAMIADVDTNNNLLSYLYELIRNRPLMYTKDKLFIILNNLSKETNSYVLDYYKFDKNRKAEVVLLHLKKLNSYIDELNGHFENNPLKNSQKKYYGIFLNYRNEIKYSLNVLINNAMISYGSSFYSGSIPCNFSVKTC